MRYESQKYDFNVSSVEAQLKAQEAPASKEFHLKERSKLRMERK